MPDDFKDFTIMGIAGSLREGSYNRAALRAAQQLAPAGIRVDLFDIKDLPLFNDDLVAHPPPGCRGSQSPRPGRRRGSVRDA